MTRRQPTNLAASVRQRLLNVAKQRGQELQLVLNEYGVERLLYRLSRSSYRERFVLKGAVLFRLWDHVPPRATRDVDFLAYGDAAPEALAAIFRELCKIDAEPDGLTFLPDSVRAAPIREAQEYGGVRVTLLAMLGTARIPLQVDVGVGDTITPAPEVVTFPTLLPFPAPRVRAYPAETAVAEKFEALVALGLSNTRMKDFRDLWAVSISRSFDGVTLAAAIGATFARRGTALPDGVPVALTGRFGRDAEKQAQWRGFLARSRLADVPTDLHVVLEGIAAFVLPPAEAAVRDQAFHAQWTPSQWTPGPTPVPD